MKRNKSGISLIVLVITIIVMIILAAAVVIALDNSGIIDKANEAVDATDIKQVQQAASLIWAEEYLAGGDNLNATYIKGKLAEQGINTDKYKITVDDKGVLVSTQYAGPTLGSLITDPTVDYGKLVDYKANGVTEWQVLYEDEQAGHVFLISKNTVGSKTLPIWYIDVAVDSLTSEELELYKKFQVGSWEKCDLNNDAHATKRITQLIKEYAVYGVTNEPYQDYVIGAIGGPTIELIAAGWNAKGNTPSLTLTKDNFGYHVNGSTGVFSLSGDGLYVPSNNSYWVASPQGYDNVCSYVVYSNKIACEGADESDHYSYSSFTHNVRPVVCLSADIPAVATGNGYSLVVD